MSLSKDARGEVTALGGDRLLRHGPNDAIQTAVSEMTRSGALDRLADRNRCSKGTARQWVGKAVKSFLHAKDAGTRRKATGFSYTVLVPG